MISAPVAFTDSGSIALTVPAVPTGMKAGVLTTPCAVWSWPRRALPSVARMSNALLMFDKTLGMNASWGALQQAGIAIGEEAIAGFDRMRVGRAHPRGAGKGADQHEQGRFRQMEVGQQKVGGAHG